MKLNGKTVVTIVLISALTTVALGHLGAARKAA
jgi:hypothetical protein